MNQHSGDTWQLKKKRKSVLIATHAQNVLTATHTYVLTAHTMSLHLTQYLCSQNTHIVHTFHMKHNFCAHSTHNNVIASHLTCSQHTKHSSTGSSPSSPHLFKMFICSELDIKLKLNDRMFICSNYLVHMTECIFLLDKLKILPLSICQLHYYSPIFLQIQNCTQMELNETKLKPKWN